MSARYIRFLTTETCSHMNNDVCSFCDFDRYWASRYPDECPWADVSQPTAHEPINLINQEGTK